MSEEDNNKFILMGLGDENSKEMAEVLGNKTSKKILDFLADRKEASEKDIADGLGMAMNTVEYNLKKLIKVGLVDKTKNFFWSVKGKKIPMYKLARKHIIISPNKKPSLDALKAILPVIGVLAIIAIIVAIVSFGGDNGMIRTDRTSFDGVSKFNSYEELESFLESSTVDSYGYYGGDMVISRSFEESVGQVTANDVASPSALPSDGDAKSSGSGTAQDYSQTNVQVEGVDEPDIVKNDDKYIYVVQGKKVIILDAFPAEEMKILEEIEFDQGVRNIFINEDKLIVFVEKYEYLDTGIQCGGILDIGIRCGGYSKTTSNVYVYDISNRENAELEKEFELDGNYVEARMKGDFVYFISSKYIDMNFLELPSYTIDGTETKLMADDIYYFDSSDENYVFNTVSAINLENGDIDSETFLLGYSTGVYVSEENIYMTYQKRLSQEYLFEKFVDEVLLEVLPAGEADEVRDVLDSDTSLREKSREVGEIFTDYTRSLDGSEQIEFLQDYSEKSEAFYEALQKEQEKTVIHRISVNENEIEYSGSGEVPGRVLNQFSMDEFEGNFRIATTTGGWNRDSNMNHVYILNEDLEVVGSVEDLAKGEQIYSARFIGDKGYMVTFRQTDPLFVIDLSDPANPEVLGELKVTGYSGYLHPYDETHLLGIGMEATEEGRTQGVKISLFDVSDFSNPREISKYEVTEGEWSSSEAIYEHKAVLFDKEKELLVIPVSYNVKTSVAGQQYPRYDYWQGAFVFNVNVEDGIDLKGKIEHEVNHEADEYYYDRTAYVKRSLFMDDVLYTISDKFVKANALGDLSQIDEVALPEIDYGGPILYETATDVGFGMDVGVAAAEPAMVK